MITEAAFIGCIWSFIVVTIITTIYQWKVRKHPLSTPYDSILAAAGLLFLFAYTLVITLLTLDFFHLAHLPGELAQKQVNDQFLKLQLVSTALNTISLWLVKLSSLCSLYPLINDNRHLRVAWFSAWITLLISWALCMACDPIALRVCAARCNTWLTMSYVRLWIYTVSDVVTSSLVMLLPLTMLLVAKTPMRRKILPAARFSSTAIIIGLSSARLGMSYAEALFVNLFWLHFFGSLQCCVALAICNGLAAIQHRNKQTRQSHSTVAKSPIVAQEHRSYDTSMAVPIVGGTVRTLPYHSKPLPSLPPNDSPQLSDVGLQSQQQEHLSLSRAGCIHSTFSFSSSSED